MKETEEAHRAVMNNGWEGQGSVRPGQSFDTPAPSAALQNRLFSDPQYPSADTGAEREAITALDR